MSVSLPTATVQSLTLFRERAGHARVPPSFVCERTGVKLGKEVVRLRGMKRRLTLPHWDQATLNALGFVWHPRQEGFETMYRCLCVFKAVQAGSPLGSGVPAGGGSVGGEAEEIHRNNLEGSVPQYKGHMDLHVPMAFVVPSGALIASDGEPGGNGGGEGHAHAHAHTHVNPYPEAAWGMALGLRCKSIREGRAYSDLEYSMRLDRLGVYDDNCFPLLPFDCLYLATLDPFHHFRLTLRNIANSA